MASLPLATCATWLSASCRPVSWPSITETASTRAWISVTALRTVSSELRTLLAVSEAFSRAWPAAVAIRRLLSFTSPALATRSEEHTSELQSLMRISYAVFCLKKKTHQNKHTKEQSTEY